MARTIDKVILGALIVLFIGMSGVFITALSDGNSRSYSDRFSVKEIQKTNFETERDFEQTEDEREIETAITGSALERASAAALAYVGEGRVTDSEVGDEEGYYEIEITLDNGNQVDVHLDENFNVISTEYEDEDDED